MLALIKSFTFISATGSELLNELVTSGECAKDSEHRFDILFLQKWRGDFCMDWVDYAVDTEDIICIPPANYEIVDLRLIDIQPF
jgi:hypothetical protein